MSQLQAYLHRIGAESGPPNLKTLAELLTRHLQSVPFENLDIQLGLPISLEPEAIFDKLVTRRRGGYCFEQNSLLERFLEELGFHVTALAARVRRGSLHLRPHTHKLLRVGWPGERLTYLVDAGFGAEGIREPLPFLAEGVSSPSGHSLVYRPDEELWVLHNAQMDLFAFNLEPHEPIDFVMYNHFTSTYPTSHFRQGVIAHIHTPKGFKTLYDHNYRSVEPDLVVERKVEDLQEVLETEFGIRGIDFAKLRATDEPAR